jgi:uncharacterized flavoprotein (TIGR03862 family)
VTVQPQATVLALGGGSWARLGSDGAWLPLLQARGVATQALQPANCGFDVQGRSGQGWTAHFASRFAGQPFKSVALACLGVHGERFARKGEFVATATGVEGSLVYAASRLLRDALTAQGTAEFALDLLPAMAPERVLAELSHPRGSKSLANHLKSRLKLDGIKMAILHELLTPDALHQPLQLAAAIKALPVRLLRARPIDEAISSAGGVDWTALDAQLMLQAAPGVFCAGEMLDWEAPTGGYLLTACFATGKAAAEGALRYLKE